MATSHPPTLAHHFEDIEQQKDSATLGMWAFLATEVMFFGGMFTAYAVYRWRYPEAWLAGSTTLDVALGGLNTAILIGSSLTVVLAIASAQRGNRRGESREHSPGDSRGYSRGIVRWLLATIGLGCAFLVVKAFEYAHKFHEHLVPGAHFTDRFEHAQTELFFGLYFAMTGMHALHMVIGIGLFLVLIAMARRGRFTPEHHTWLEACGLYWHFVDIVWIFLFPLLYLLGRHP